MKRGVASIGDGADISVSIKEELDALVVAIR